MPRLPSAESLGPLRSPASGRPIGTTHTTAAGEGMMAFGGALARAGEVLWQKNEEQRKKDEALDESRAVAAYLTGEEKINQGFTDDDPDFEKWPETYEKKSNELLETALSAVRDENRREILRNRFAPRIVQGISRIQERVKSRQNDRVVAESNERLEELRRIALEEQDPAKRDEAISAGTNLLNSLVEKGVISAHAGQRYRQQWVEKYAEGRLRMAPADERLDALQGPVGDMAAYVNRVIGVESGGDPNAKARTSSATGLGQFIESTWLEFFREMHPEAYREQSRGEILSLRRDPKLSRQAVEWYTRKNAGKLQAAGLETNFRNLYLAHFLGPGDAIKVLKADPAAPVSDHVNASSIAANKSILSGKTVGQVLAWAGRKMGSKGSLTEVASLLPPDQRQRMKAETENEIARTSVQASAERGEMWERVFIDSQAKGIPLPPREALESDPVLSEQHRNTLLRQYDNASKEIESLRQTVSRFSDPNATFNPFSNDDRKLVDKMYQVEGGGLEGLKKIVDRTNIFPDSAVPAMRSALASGNSESVAAAMQIASNAMRINPHIFTSVTNGKSLQEAAIEFNYATGSLGLSAQAAAERWIKKNDPEEQARVKRIVKETDINGVLRKQVTSGALARELSSHFDPSIFESEPKVGFNAEMRGHMVNSYREIIEEEFEVDGDIDAAKNRALDRVSKMWGVTYVNGSGVLMRYAPEKAPVYADIPDIGELIADHAVEEIEKLTGKKIDRSKLMLLPIDSRTRMAWENGQHPPYMLMWQNEDGSFEQLSPGQAFVFSRDEALARRTEKRRVEFERQRQTLEQYETDTTEGISALPEEQRRSPSAVSSEFRRRMYPGEQGIVDSLPPLPEPSRPPLRPYSPPPWERPQGGDK